MQMHNPPHPGRILREALESIPISVSEFAAHIGVSRVTLSRVINARAGITPEMSIRLSQAFGQPSGDIWFKMQTKHDFWHASRARRKKIRPLKIKTKMPTAA
jgi:addiction module HigA family antidote